MMFTTGTHKHITRETNETHRDDTRRSLAQSGLSSASTPHVVLTLHDDGRHGGVEHPAIVLVQLRSHCRVVCEHISNVQSTQSQTLLEVTKETTNMRQREQMTVRRDRGESRSSTAIARHVCRGGFVRDEESFSSPDEEVVEYEDSEA